METLTQFDLDALEIERFEIEDTKGPVAVRSTPAGMSCFRTCSCFALCQMDAAE